MNDIDNIEVAPEVTAEQIAEFAEKWKAFLKPIARWILRRSDENDTQSLMTFHGFVSRSVCAAIYLITKRRAEMEKRDGK